MPQYSKLMAALPPYYARSGVMQALQYAAARELSRIEAEIDVIAREFSPTTATNTLPAWEAEYGIAGEGEDLAARRAAVAVKMRGASATTRDRLAKIVEEMRGGQAIITEQNRLYTVLVGYTATLTDAAAARLAAALRAVIPAHIALNVAHTDVQPVEVYAAAAGLRREIIEKEVTVNDP